MASTFDWKDEILAASKRIQGHVRRTPLEHSLIMSEMSGGNVYIKLESEQITGAFKLRGAFNCIMKMKEDGELREGVTPTIASTGNHAIACNYALGKLGLKGLTFTATTIDPVKEATLRRMGANLVKHGTDCVEGEREARRTAEENGYPYISPYNNRVVAAGQGTIGVEIYEDLKDVDVVFVPVGGGGLIGGIAAYLKAVRPSVHMVGCQPINSKIMAESVKAGKIITEEQQDTLSDGTAGDLELDSVTLQPCMDYVDEWVLLSEDEIADAVYFMIEHHHKIVEGATGLALGAFLRNPAKYKGKNAVVIACGANIGVQTLRKILNRKLDK